VNRELLRRPYRSLARVPPYSFASSSS
jgi:hypothetical protein